MTYVIGFLIGVVITAIFFVIRQRKILQKLKDDHTAKLESELRYSQDEHSLELQATISQYKMQIQEIHKINEAKLQETIQKLNKKHKTKLESELRYSQDEHSLELQATISQYKMQIQEIHKINEAKLQEIINKLNEEHKAKLESELGHCKTEHYLELKSLQNQIQFKKQATIIFVETLVKIWTDSEQINNLTAIYTPLKNYLSHKEWEKADQETATLIFNACNAKHSYLEIEEIASLSPEVLLTIDFLWLHYSQNLFGFSIQQEMLKNNNSSIPLIEEEWRKVGCLLGWNKDGVWISGYNQLNFSQNAPRGQFPFFVLWKGTFWGSFIDSQSSRFTSLMRRFSDCKLDLH